MGFDDPALIAGQFCGDFVRGSSLSHFPERVETGIRLHRYLDRHTDTHPQLQEVRAQLQGVPLRFSGIVTDVLFDHHLACHWEHYSALSLRAHADQVHAALEQHHAVLPVSLQRFMRVLVNERLLEANTDMASIERALSRLSRRSPRFAPLAVDQAQLAILYRQLQPVFAEFQPALLQAARSWLDLYNVQ